MKNYNSSKEIIIFIPSIESGGVEKNFFILLKFLLKFYTKINLVTSSKIKLSKHLKKVKIIKPNSKFWINQNRLVKSIVCLFLLIKFFPKNKFLLFSFQSNFFSIIASKLMGWPIILRLNTSPEKYVNNFFKIILFKTLYKLGDEIIVNSKEFKNNIKRVLGLNSIVIYNPVYNKRIREKKIEVLKKYKGLKILNIGRLTDQKDHLTLLKSIKVILDKKKIDLKLFIIGGGQNFVMLKNYINQNQLHKNIFLLGYKKNAFEYMRSFDLFILSSRYEGLPNTLIEAQISKLPIISSDCPSGPKEILMNGKLGTLFKTGNYQDLSKKILLFCENRKKFELKAAKAKKYLRRFDENKNLTKFLMIINKYIKN